MRKWLGSTGLALISYALMATDAFAAAAGGDAEVEKWRLISSAFALAIAAALQALMKERPAIPERAATCAFP